MIKTYKNIILLKNLIEFFKILFVLQLILLKSI